MDHVFLFIAVARSDNPTFKTTLVVQGDPMSKADSPMPLSKNAAQTVVTDLNMAYAKLDDLLAHTLRASANMIEVGRSMGLDPLSGQKIFSDLTRCTNAILQSRQSLVEAHSKAHRIRKRSEVADENLFGCPREKMQSGKAGVPSLFGDMPGSAAA
ncbi:hypothetical protein K7W03_16330 [Sphingobium sp. PNB]|nr:hypothetical protein [Sphingobium sp. PNB]MCB4861158.1 hypothetical protein [Sphingobium sp. PNB]